MTKRRLKNDIIQELLESTELDESILEINETDSSNETDEAVKRPPQKKPKEVITLESTDEDNFDEDASNDDHKAKSSKKQSKKKNDLPNTDDEEEEDESDEDFVEKPQRRSSRKQSDISKKRTRKKSDLPNTDDDEEDDESVESEECDEDYEEKPQKKQSKQSNKSKKRNKKKSALPHTDDEEDDQYEVKRSVRSKKKVTSKRDDWNDDESQQSISSCELSSDSKEYDIEAQTKSSDILEFFNNSSASDMQSLINITDAKAKILISLRPFEDINEIVRVFTKLNTVK